MKDILRHIAKPLGIASMIMAAISVTSCHKKLEPTPIKVEDSIRHYMPVILGDVLDMVYTVRNIGDEVLVITDIQPSCPTIESSEANVTTIPPGEESDLKFRFHSDKNIGFARHSIRIFGNIAPRGVAEIIFDTHIVRPSVDLSDYEEHYQKKEELSIVHIYDRRYSEREYTTDVEKQTKPNRQQQNN